METKDQAFTPLPIIVGITGHRNIPDQAVLRLEEQVKAQFAKMKARYPHCPVIVLSSLAEGADRLCARAALAMGVKLWVPLPMAQDEYEKDFAASSRQEFYGLLAGAERVFVVNPLEPVPEQTPARGFFYRQAGLYTVSQAHLLIALWDGRETLFSEGGGTYETVSFAKQQKIPLCHLPVPRFSVPSDMFTEANITAANVSDANMPGANRLPVNKPQAGLTVINDKRLAEINSFNREIARNKSRLDEIVAENKPGTVDRDTEKGLSGGLHRTLQTYLYADALSLYFRDRKLLVLKLLSSLGLLLVLSFLLYDELESDLMLMVYGIAIVIAFVIYMISSVRGYHNRYISCRALAEALRVQFYWHLGGIRENAYDNYTYVQKAELDFVRFIFRSINLDFADDALRVGSPAHVPAWQAEARRECVYRGWVKGQYDYHATSAKRKGGQYRRNNLATRLMLTLSVLIFIMVAVMEGPFKGKMEEVILLPEALRRSFRIHGGTDIIWRSQFKILLGIISAGTAFLANYYGGLSLPQQILDNQRMTALFGDDLPADGQALTDAHLRMLGKESIIESGSWYLAQKENAPGLFIN